MVTATSICLLVACTKDRVSTPVLTADFTIREFIWDPDFRSKATYDTDSVSTPEVVFTASNKDHTNVAYEWTVGTDARTFTDTSFMLNFADAPTDAVTVTLKATRLEPGGGKQEQTKTRTFYLRRQPRFAGRFEGYFEGIPQKATVAIKNHEYINTGYHNFRGILITSDVAQFASLFSPCDWNEHLVLNQRVYFDFATVYNEQANPHLKHPNGDISFDPSTKELRINMTAVSVSTGKRIPVRFRGKRVQ